MIRMIQSRSAKHAKIYFEDALIKSDYYLDEAELQGKIGGRLALRLGVGGSVNKEIFFSLCENRHPLTGASLTPRTKIKRTVGYDITFLCPKSVSILHALSKDDHILKAFEDCVDLTMRDIERDCKTRVRKDGLQDERVTGELIWTSFVHQTARAVEGSLPDPHLHAHCFTFNATWDEKEEKFKAAQFRDIKMKMPVYQAIFHKRLSDKLLDLGYDVEKKQYGFEVKGVPQKVIDLFSKRTKEIAKIAKEKGITDPKELDELGARTRSSKQKGLSMNDLKHEWRKQIQELKAKDGGFKDKTIRHDPNAIVPNMTPRQCVDYALDHCFERASVVPYHRLFETALKYSVGTKGVTLDALEWSFKTDNRIIKVNEGNKDFCTTREVLEEEHKMVRLALSGQGKMKPLFLQVPAIQRDGQQKDAIRHILTTSHQVSIIRGVAGGGKTSLMREAIEWIRYSGREVTVVAPTAKASREVLRAQGFEKADTVAKLLTDKTMKKGLTNQVIWVDEAGLLGNREMVALLELATENNARLILGGDTRQHSSVDRGDALRILNKVAGIQTSEVSQIKRQRDLHFKEIVESLSQGDVKSAFNKLDKNGSIRQIETEKLHEVLVEDYIELVKNKKSVLVISPTHEDGNKVSEAIRSSLKTLGMIDKKDKRVLQYKNLNLTEAQKSDWRVFKDVDVVQFNQNLKGIKNGSVWKIEDCSNQGVIISNNKKQTLSLPLDKARHFNVYKKSEINLSKGDKIRITKNGLDTKKKKLENDQLLEVISISKLGNIKLKSSLSEATYTIKKDHGHLNHAYCITSHASQGRDVDEVLISQPSTTLGATDSKQLYVSVSRAKERARIYTDDKKELLTFASRLRDRESAIELVSKKEKSSEQLKEYIQRNIIKESINQTVGQSKNTNKGLTKKDKSYEPSL